MPELQKMPERMQERMQKHSFSSTFSRYSKALKLAGIIAISSIITGCATSNYNVRASNDTVKNEYVQQKTVSAEKIMDINGNSYNIRLETNDNEAEIKTYSDNSYFDSFNISQIIDENFFGKFSNRQIEMGNPSFIVKGIDGKGNYAYLLFSDVQGKVHRTPIISGFNAEILKKMGVEVKCIFDEKKKEWRISYMGRTKEVAYVIFSEDGKDLERTGDMELYKEHQLVRDKDRKE